MFWPKVGEESFLGAREVGLPTRLKERCLGLNFLRGGLDFSGSAGVAVRFLEFLAVLLSRACKTCNL